MAVVKPANFFRVNPNLAKDVVCMPYDVVNVNEIKELSKNENSYVNVIRSEVHTAGGLENPYKDEVYFEAKKNLNDLIARKVFNQENSPVYYVLRQTIDGHTQTGIVGLLSTEDYHTNVIKKHELTREAKEKDRINHFNVCGGNTEPVFLTYKKNDGINSIIQSVVNGKDPIIELTYEDVFNELFVLTDTNVLEKIEQIFNGIDSLYIADGHHRAASAYKNSLLNKDNPNAKFFLGVVFPDEDMKIIDYNRVIFNVKISADEVIEKISKKFDIEKIGSNIYAPKTVHEFGMFLDKNWYKLNVKKEYIKQELPDRLDVSLLYEYVLNPVFGIIDQRTDNSIDFIGGTRGLKYLEDISQKNNGAAFALFPVKISDLMAISDANKIMPPKSTWFIPKLLSGLFFYLY